MNNINPLIVSPILSKSDKYIPFAYLNKIYESCDNIRDKAYIMYHAETGLRVSDVLGTEIVHIDWPNCRTYTYDFKKDKWRYIYWPQKVGAILKQWLKQRQNENIKDKKLFPFTSKTANRILKYWCKQINFQFTDQVSSHWLRHTFIRFSRKAGRDIKAVQQNTGDTINTLLDWYSDLSMEDMQEEIKKIV
ncbi:MAG TPA: site-specific integrase [Gammaproteobacteria bacterium]|nr:site-specific integrase [Gammaproteobacteria bacterium]